jgi:hypothetical protein
MHTPFFPSWRPLLAPLRSRRPSATHSLERATLSQIEQRLAPALPSDLLAKPATGPHSRHRMFSLGRTFWGWIWQIFQSNTSCREVVRQLQALLGVLEQAPIDDDASAYCQARAKFSLPLLERALTASHQSAQKHAPACPLLQGRPLKVVDASSVRLEDTPQNRQAFPASKNQFSRPAFPVLKFLTVFSLASGALLARATGTLQVAELRLLMSLGEHFKPGDIITGDRAYGLYVVLHWVDALGADLVARLNTRSRHVDFRRATKKLGPRDGLFLWQKPRVPSKLLSAEQWAAVPETLVVRILRLRVEKPGFRTRELTIVTTLLDAELYPAAEILEVYFKRWRLEMCLDDLKTTLAMEKLKCRTPALVQKELLVFLIAHNFLRWIMCQAAQAAAVKVEAISFTGTLDAFRQWSIGFTQVRGPGKLAKQKRLWREFLRILTADLLPERPGRSEPRAVKKKSKYPRLTKPRHRYVERWSRNKRRRAQRAAKNHANLN